MKTTIEINKSELLLALSEFSKFDVEKRGHQLCSQVWNYISCTENELPTNSKEIKSIVDKATDYRNLFSNQAALVADFILSITDADFIEGVNRKLNNDYSTFGI